MSSFQEQLEAACPPSTDQALILGVQQGVLLAASSLENDSYLKTAVGRDLKGHLRRAAIMFRLREMCVSGDLPFEGEIGPMPRGGGHWLEMKSGQFRAHVYRTDSPTAFPEDTPTRQDLRLSNQPDLFDASIIMHPSSAPGLQSVWLTFGADGKTLHHLCWAMPQAGQDLWLARINVLVRAAASAKTPTEEVPSHSMKLKFRDHVEESLKREEDARGTKR